MNEPDRPQGIAKPARQEPAATEDELAGSVTRWLDDLKGGDRQAFQPLWDRYYAMLVERARVKLSSLRGPRALDDEEDVALSAFHSLYQGVREGRFPRLDDRDDLWKLLVHLTACKVVDHQRAPWPPKTPRGAERSIMRQDIRAAGCRDSTTTRYSSPLDRIIGSEPSPEFAAMVAEEYVRRLDELGDETLSRIAELKLACYSNDEIRRQLGCSLRSVTLKLELIRKKWQER